MDKESSKLDVPIAASKLFVALRTGGRSTTLQQARQPCRQGISSAAKGNVILEHQLLISQQKRVIDHLETVLSSHKEMVAVLTDDLDNTRHRLAAIKQEKDLLTEEVAFLSSLVVSELPEQFTRPVQQSTVFHLPQTSNEKRRPHCSCDKECVEPENDNAFSADLSYRPAEGSNATSVSSLDTDESVTDKDDEYYDDASCESELSKPKITEEQKVHPLAISDLLGSSSLSGIWKDSPNPRYSIYRGGGLGLPTSKRHDCHLELLRRSQPNAADNDIPAVIFVPTGKNLPVTSSKKKVENSSMKDQTGESHQLKRQAMFSAMMEQVDSADSSGRKRQKTMQSGSAKAQHFVPLLLQMRGSFSATAVRRSILQPRRGRNEERGCKSV